MLVKNPQTGKIEIVRTPSETAFWNTGRVRIGILHQHPAPAMSCDAERLQAALLGWRKPSILGFFRGRP
jgi:hypothetical protein